jgi:hypothetical protein
MPSVSGQRCLEQRTPNENLKRVAFDDSLCLIHSLDAVIHSPAGIIAAGPTTVTRSRWPRAFALRTQKPFSLLWKVTRSTRPASTSWVDGSRLDFIRVAGSSMCLLALRL